MKNPSFGILLILSSLVCCTKMNRPFSLDYALKGKNSARPIICGHRGGYDLDFPENSISRFVMDAQACKGSGIMIELDVRKSADGILYILHDESLDRTTTGAGKIKDATAANLNQLFLKAKTDSITAERIPTFESILNWAKLNPAVFLMVDVKDDIWEAVLQMIKEKEVVNRCVILTFSIENTRKVYAISPDIWISTLISTVLFHI
jgi:glycerophosphoryl diester phosphodiesterase